MGIIVAFVMKYLGNIHKLLMTAAAMYVSAALTASVFGILPTPMFAFGLLLNTVAIGLFNWQMLSQIKSESLPAQLQTFLHYTKLVFEVTSGLAAIPKRASGLWLFQTAGAPKQRANSDKELLSA